MDPHRKGIERASLVVHSWLAAFQAGHTVEPIAEMVERAVDDYLAAIDECACGDDDVQGVPI